MNDLPADVEAVLAAVLQIGRYSVRKVWAATRRRGIGRNRVLRLERVFEAAGVVERPGNRLGRRRLLTRDRAEAEALLRRYLKG